MGRIWTKAFWRDATERILSTFLAVVIGFVTTEGFSWASLGHWEFWAPIVVTTAVTAGKAILAGLASPNTGASFGTTVPGDLVKAFTTQTEQRVDGDKIGMGYPDEVLAHPGDTVAGPAAEAKTGTPVEEPVAVPRID